MAENRLFFAILFCFLLSGTLANFAADQKECGSQLTTLSACIPYVQGNANIPTKDCCNGLLQLHKNTPKCLCVLIKDSTDPQLGITINVTLALQLPEVCKVATNISTCPALLHMSPNSPEAQIFNRTSSTSTPVSAAPRATPSASSNSTSSSSKSSSHQLTPSIFTEIMVRRDHTTRSISDVGASRVDDDWARSTAIKVEKTRSGMINRNATAENPPSQPPVPPTSLPPSQAEVLTFIGKLEVFTVSMINSLIGLVRSCKCVLFGVAEECYDKDEQQAVGFTEASSTENIQIEEGHCTCPKSGQKLLHTNLIPNHALRSLICQWCEKNGVPFEKPEKHARNSALESIATTKAALEATKMTATFLVENLSTGTTEVKKRVAYELRLLAKCGMEKRACIVEAGAIPFLLSLLSSDNPKSQDNALMALLNLSIYENNKVQIVEAGCLDAIIRVLKDGRSLESCENAAATLFSLSVIDNYK
ncbi:hypothetical protein KI387_005220 [Taxus chinensis]|uniref:RING-type E3 ubiquitin transferase n=1 Tax=Taxus chinensis TaxID=29808 RepID=A0AA38LL25_TAXCH|nr:hypothetical protein KI387_005220 [Taxus chinensis]